VSHATVYSAVRRPDLHPNWSKVVQTIKRDRNWDDGRLSRELDFLGVSCHRSNLNKMVNNKQVPKYDIGAALVWLRDGGRT